MLLSLCVKGCLHHGGDVGLFDLTCGCAYFLRRCQEEGLDTGASGGTPVIPVIVGDSLRAAKLSAMLLAAGVNVQPMVAPAVPNDRARLRFFVASTHTDAEIDTTVRIVVEAMRALERTARDDTERARIAGALSGRLAG